MKNLKKVKNYENCPYLENGKYCVHKDNNDIHSSTTAKQKKLRKKKCRELFCPFKKRGEIPPKIYYKPI